MLLSLDLSHPASSPAPWSLKTSRAWFVRSRRISAQFYEHFLRPLKITSFLQALRLVDRRCNTCPCICRELSSSESLCQLRQVPRLLKPGLGTRILNLLPWSPPPWQVLFLAWKQVVWKPIGRWEGGLVKKQAVDFPYWHQPSFSVCFAFSSWLDFAIANHALSSFECHSAWRFEMKVENYCHLCLLQSRARCVQVGCCFHSWSLFALCLDLLPPCFLFKIINLNPP